MGAGDITMNDQRAAENALIDRVEAAVAEVRKALALVWETQGTAEANDALLAMGVAQKEFSEARREMKVLLEELKAES